MKNTCCREHILYRTHSIENTFSTLTARFDEEELRLEKLKGTSSKVSAIVV